MPTEQINKLYSMVEAEAPSFTAVIRDVARLDRNEREFQTAITKHIESFANKVDVDLLFREEYTLATGRADAVYNRLVIEYERPGSMRLDLEHGHTYVIDIAKLKSDEQTLVFGDVLRTIYGLYSGESGLDESEELPEKVIIFVDELNKYAPASTRGQETPILDQVLDIAERGRSFGVVLFSAQQFLSAVHPRVVGNAASKILGRTDSAEINEGPYRFIDREVRGHLTRLNKGELILSHPIYRQPVKIMFPRPPFQQGRART